MATTLITGGTVVNADSAVSADVLIEDERIEAVAAPGRLTADRTVDASGKLILPGGVDVHTHLEYPVDAFSTNTADDFRHGTISAAHGGTTTVVDFVKTPPDQTLRDAYLRRRDAVEDKAIVDVGLHAIVPPVAQQATVHDDLESLVAEGATSWKFFMAYPSQMIDDGELLRGFELARELGVLPMVHAENGHLVARDIDRLVRAGHTAESFHAQAHSHSSEAEAVHRAMVLAEAADTPVYLVHISSSDAAAEVERQRARGVRVWAETCPQYLAAAYEDYADLGPQAAAWLCSPPIRERSNQAGLWSRLSTGVLSVVATDHAGFCLHQPDDLPPQKLRSRGYFPKVPNGVPGVEDRLMVLWQTGVVAGRLSPTQFVDLTAARPAKLFGMFPRKGTVTAGADADLLIWDPDCDHTITAADSHTRTDYNLYEGMHVTGRPTKVFSRGDLIVDHGELDAEPGRGEFLRRNAPHIY